MKKEEKKKGTMMISRMRRKGKKVEKGTLKENEKNGEKNKKVKKKERKLVGGEGEKDKMEDTA